MVVRPALHRGSGKRSLFPGVEARGPWAKTAASSVGAAQKNAAAPHPVFRVGRDVGSHEPQLKGFILGSNWV